MRISNEDRGERFADVDGVRGETKEEKEEKEEKKKKKKKKKKTEEESRIESGSKQTTDVCVHEEEKEELGERGYDFVHGRSVGRLSEFAPAIPQVAAAAGQSVSCG
ncbi:hypothetical protein LZ31DRAFT_573682 [Colletotrichum somersetense]|nr:hypothetical protein LZ31DRAFT_573682 [Colletotrichum somersetense]